VDPADREEILSVEYTRNTHVWREVTPSADDPNSQLTMFVAPSLKTLFQTTFLSICNPTLWFKKGSSRGPVRKVVVDYYVNGGSTVNVIIESIR